MTQRRLNPEERDLWRRVTQDVRALEKPSKVLITNNKTSNPPNTRDLSPPLRPSPSTSLSSPANTLDGTWDRRLRRGLASPDMTLDLHGHSLASAYRALDLGLARAVANEVRLLLLVTGRPPRGDLGQRPVRGVIRAAVGDWLGASPYASRIVAVRNAHPRHGGAGALYVVLRRA